MAVVPHLALRKYIDVYPSADGADYVAILLNDTYYPLNKDEMMKKVEELRNDSTWEPVYDRNSLLFYKRKTKF